MNYKDLVCKINVELRLTNQIAKNESNVLYFSYRTKKTNKNVNIKLTIHEVSEQEEGFRVDKKYMYGIFIMMVGPIQIVLDFI